MKSECCGADITLPMVGMSRTKIINYPSQCTKCGKQVETNPAPTEPRREPGRWRIALNGMKRAYQEQADLALANEYEDELADHILQLERERYELHAEKAADKEAISIMAHRIELLERERDELRDWLATWKESHAIAVRENGELKMKVEELERLTDIDNRIKKVYETVAEQVLIGVSDEHDSAD